MFVSVETETMSYSDAQARREGRQLHLALGTNTDPGCGILRKRCAYAGVRHCPAEVGRRQGAVADTGHGGLVSDLAFLRWQRRRFREYRIGLSRRPNRGRQPVNAAIKTLIARVAAANPLWGAPRIHGELLKLGIDVAERTVSRPASSQGHGHD
jgi:hypothetical protein